MTPPISSTQLVTITVLPVMPNTWSNIYPTKKGDGCGWGIQGFGNLILVGCQDPDPPSAKRIWTSIDTRTKIFVSAQVEVA
ncbi:hypothetical protein glysoja_041856 [Glycine soja]|uniref:Uncharacterized protein n=1 Tax=Glycine soja TaxID=3848 RepID=A0A0B2PA08_GLYSO|nr:hypothetical protein glysoja_041856 [Glycine soja]